MSWLEDLRKSTIMTPWGFFNSSPSFAGLVMFYWTIRWHANILGPTPFSQTWSKIYDQQAHISVILLRASSVTRIFSARRSECNLVYCMYATMKQGVPDGTTSAFISKTFYSPTQKKLVYEETPRYLNIPLESRWLHYFKFLLLLTPAKRIYEVDVVVLFVPSAFCLSFVLIALILAMKALSSMISTTLLRSPLQASTAQQGRPFLVLCLSWMLICLTMQLKLLYRGMIMRHLVSTTCMLQDLLHQPRYLLPCIVEKLPWVTL